MQRTITAIISTFFDLRASGYATMVLTQEEIDGCRDAFLAFDKDRSGTIDVWELRQVLEAMGQKPTEEELFQMISEVDDNMSGSIDFAEFLKVLCRAFATFSNAALRRCSQLLHCIVFVTNKQSHAQARDELKFLPLQMDDACRSLRTRRCEQKSLMMKQT
jgi:EF-hand domain pair